MTRSYLYVGDKLSSEVPAQLTATDRRIVQVTRLPIVLGDHVSATIQLQMGSVEGRSRLLYWFRQNEAPARIFCGLRPFEVVKCDRLGMRSASDYVNAQIVRVTRLLETALL